MNTEDAEGAEGHREGNVMTPKVLFEVRLWPSDQATGFTRHQGPDGPLPKPAVLRIVRFDDDPAVYLCHYDEEGVEMTDTWHSSADDAFEQAQLEFGIEPERWESCE